MIHMPNIEKAAPESCICDMLDDFCVCCPLERAIRLYASGDAPEPMTQAQREECLKEIARVEGYDRADYESVDDTMLAHGVFARGRITAVTRGYYEHNGSCSICLW